ncbi:MAG: porin family protein [Gemmatimonadota bacterium]
MKTLRFCFALLLVAAMFTPSESSAQTVIGAKAGIASSEISFSSEGISVSADSRTGFVGGVFANLGLGEMWFIQPEVLYAAKGASFEGETLAVDYLEVPVLFGAAFPISNSAFKPMLFAGPSIAFKLSCDDSGFDCSDDVKSVDFGLVFGGGIQYALENLTLFFDARYDLGLTDVNDDDTEFVEVKNRSWQFMAGLGFPLGK